MSPYIKKGDGVYIEGRLRTRSWEDKEGNTRYTTEVLCDNLEMLGKRKLDQTENTKMAKEPELPTPEPGEDLSFSVTKIVKIWTKTRSSASYYYKKIS